MESLLQLVSLEARLEHLKHIAPTIRFQYHKCTDHYIILNITLYDNAVKMKLFYSRDRERQSYLRIDEYFYIYQKKEGMPARAGIFKIIDKIAEAADCSFAYIQDDIHEYVRKNFRIKSRNLDVLAGDRTFYQRGWPGSILAREQQIKSRIRSGRHVTASVIHDWSQRARVAREAMASVNTPDIMREASAYKNRLLKEQVPQDVLAQQCARLYHRMSAKQQGFRFWSALCSDFDTVMKFYGFHAVHR